MIPRKWDCGDWPLMLAWSNIVSNLIITAAYYAISCILCFYYKRRYRIIPEPHILLCFIAFIFFCGTTHLFQVLVFWYPAYEWATVIDMLTALMSIITVTLLPMSVYRIMQYKSPEEYKDVEIKLRQQMATKRRLLDSITKTNDTLSQRVEYLENYIRNSEWIHKHQLNIDELKGILNTLRHQEDVIRETSDSERI